MLKGLNKKQVIEKKKKTILITSNDSFKIYSKTKKNNLGNIGDC